MILLFSIACFFLVISYFDTRFFYPLYLIYVAFISNNSTLHLFNQSLAISWPYIIFMLALLVYKNFKTKSFYHQIYFKNSKITVLAYLASFIIPFAWNYFYFNIVAIDFFINHLYAGVTAYLFSLLTYKNSISLKDYFQCYARIGLYLILFIAPQSIWFFYKSGGLGFGRFRSSEMIDIPYVWTYRLNEESFLFKTTTHGSYLLTFFSAILISAAIIKYFESNKKKDYIICMGTIFITFITIYVNQYLTTTLIFVINTLLGAIFCFYITPRKNFKTFFPILGALSLVAITLTPSSQIIKSIQNIQGSLFRTNSFPVAKVDLLQQLEIMHNGPNESVNRITLLFRSLEKLKQNQLITKGIGIPKHIDLNTNTQVEATRHTLGLDYIIYFGIFIGTLVIFIKLFSFFYESGKALLKKPFASEDLYILNGAVALIFMFFIGRMDYYKWSLLCLLGLWVTPFIHTKMSIEITRQN